MKSYSLLILIMILSILNPAVANSIELNNVERADITETITINTESGFVEPAPAVKKAGEHDAVATEVLDIRSSQEENGSVNASAWRAEVVNKFSKAYISAGKPKIAILWNYIFDDNLSQWYSNKRTHVSKKDSINMTYKSEGSEKLNDAKDIDAINFTADGKTELEQKYAQCDDGGCYQVLKQRRIAGDRINNKSQEFELNSGFVSTFLSGNVKLIDRAAIMRIEQRNQAKNGQSIDDVDRQLIETDAFLKHAEYITEIIYSNDPNAHLGVEFLVTIKAIKTGEIMVMFRTEALPVDLKSPETKFIATSNGFVKTTTTDPTSPKQVGEQLAYETMEALIARL